MMMKRNDYYYLAGRLYNLAESLPSYDKLSVLILELITKLNKDKKFEELLLDDVQKDVSSLRSDREVKSTKDKDSPKANLFGF